MSACICVCVFDAHFLLSNSIFISLVCQANVTCVAPTFRSFDLIYLYLAPFTVTERWAGSARETGSCPLSIGKHWILPNSHKKWKERNKQTKKDGSPGLHYCHIAANLCPHIFTTMSTHKNDVNNVMIKHKTLSAQQQQQQLSERQMFISFVA